MGVRSTLKPFNFNTWHKKLEWENFDEFGISKARVVHVFPHLL